MIDTEKMREAFACLTSRVSSHYDGCEYVHPYCAIELLLREVERLRGTAEQLNRALSQKSGDIESQQDEAMEAFRGIDWEPKPDRPSTPAAYACPSCDIDDGWSAADSERERVYPSEPDWLLAPDTMPEDLAPAQMIAVYERIGNVRTERNFRADTAPWGLKPYFKYRPLYSDSGLPLCSAEGLDERAKYVCADGFAVWQTDAKPRYSGAGWGGDGFSVRAPSTHRKPGDWRSSLMEVTRR